MTFRTHKRAFAFAPLLAVVALISACDDDPVAPPDPAEDLAIVRLFIGEDTVDIASAGGSVTIPEGETDVNATFLDADENELAIPSTEFELRFESEDTAIVTFTRSSAFAGSLTGVAPGTTTVDVTLWHLEEDHGDFGPQDLVVTVQ